MITFSIGSSGVDVESYSLYIPLFLSSGTAIDLENLPYISDVEGLTIILEKHYYLYSLKVSSFVTYDEAQSYLEKIFSGLHWISLKNRLGIKFTKEIQKLNIYEEPVLVAEKSNIYELISNAGWTYIDGEYDADKPAIISEHRHLLRLGVPQATIALDYSPESVISDLQQFLRFSSCESITQHKKLCLAIELYSAYSFEVTLTGRFVKLVTVLESLLDEISIPDDTKVLLKEAKASPIQG